jgi:hypothetical protein
MKKIAFAALAALTLLTTIAAATGDAEARRWRGGWGYRGAGIGFGIAAGLLAAGAIAAATAPVCATVPVYDRFENIIGYRSVC